MGTERVGIHTGRRIAHPELTEREELVLRYIVQNFVLTATPVGSRYLSKRLDEESISAATIRNVMADLEEKGFITHPHTSAGRVPTDLGYRFYVDLLVGIEKLTKAEEHAISSQIDATAPTPVVMKNTSRLLSAISSQLGIVTAPELLNGVLERLELVQLSSTRLLVVLSLKAGFVKTMTLELHEEVSREHIGDIVQLLNERLAGLTIYEIRNSYHDRLKDIAEREHGNGIVRLFLDSADRIFVGAFGVDRIHISPSQSILHHPEFSSPEQFRGIVELIENEEVVVHLLEESNSNDNTVAVTIGSEHNDERMIDYSMIATRYRIGDQLGTIGLIGPKRMNYSRLITMVEYVAKTLSGHFQDRSNV